ncbi:MAG TPA: phosphohistidine phosphatase SixA [Planctomycetaceae bacterium]|jgi:phosphohistidine phosphatase|nr:phosphohistidine phosphatase SixA [Planctomycetaceae bacterium]
MATNDNQRKIVYLVRHGEAASTEVDPARPLTQAGRLAVERIAAWAAAVDIRPDEVLHSGKLRAEQTAEILADYLMPAKGATVRRCLGADDDVRPLADSLAASDHRLMIVGHFPFLGRLVSHLVIGDVDRPIVQFEAAGLVGIQFQDGRWTITCVVDPELIP